VNEDELGRRSTWDDEDAQLLWQATARADALMRDLARGKDTQADVEALLGYLREVVLARISDEDRYALPMLRQAPGAHADLDSSSSSTCSCGATSTTSPQQRRGTADVSSRPRSSDVSFTTSKATLLRRPRCCTATGRPSAATSAGWPRTTGTGWWKVR